MTTLSALVDRAEAALSDSANAVWSAAQIQEWLEDAVRDYSNYFPRRRVTTVTTSANDRDYDLPTDLVALALVEYPTGEDPPTYLERRPRSHPAFWDRSGFYDLELSRDNSAPQLYISEKPAAGETITLTYLAHHDPDASTITVPEPHEPILIAYVVVMAWQERLANEQQDPTSNSTLLLSQYATNLDRARRAYVQALQRARITAAGESARVRWRMDKHDRIY